MRNFWLVPFPSLMSWSPTVPLSTLVWEGNTYLSFRERKARSCTLHEMYWRYGDGLHPWGDLVTMARVHCMLRDGGQVMVGIPVANEDNIVYNAHRWLNLCSERLQLLWWWCFHSHITLGAMAPWCYQISLPTLKLSGHCTHPGKPPGLLVNLECKIFLLQGKSKRFLCRTWEART